MDLQIRRGALLMGKPKQFSWSGFFRGLWPGRPRSGPTLAPAEKIVVLQNIMLAKQYYAKYNNVWR